MIGTRREERTDDGYLLVIDPPRGIGMICEPTARMVRANSRLRDGASWRVITLIMRFGNAEAVDFTTDYSRN